ncbi:MAG: hypothetical protein K2Z81_18600, partial [Cyanobacteria bacterium]|nr:hypothetical protein [Cyanobacteriota bacterium]
PAMVRQSFEVDGVGGGVAGVEVAAEVEFEVEVVADEEVGAVEVVVTGVVGSSVPITRQSISLTLRYRSHSELPRQ